MFFVAFSSGEPTKGKTKPETILRQLTTKKGQVILVPASCSLQHYFETV